jgi:excisionase family DNA binding protein
MNNDEKVIPFWLKYVMTVEEASQYFRIGENKLRKLIGENKNANWVLWNGNRAQIKRNLFERYIDTVEAI